VIGLSPGLRGIVAEPRGDLVAGAVEHAALLRAAPAVVGVAPAPVFPGRSAIGAIAGTGATGRHHRPAMSGIPRGTPAGARRVHRAAALVATIGVAVAWVRAAIEFLARFLFRHVSVIASGHVRG